MKDDLKTKIKQNIDERKLVNLIEKLVAIPSYPGVQNQETKVAQCIKEVFTAHGIDAEIQPVVNGRCNIVARLTGSGKGNSLMLTGHMDTVPPYDMKDDPFKTKTKDGRLYGRGVVDMKGALACMIMAMIAIKNSGIELQGDLLFAGVIDEEDKSEGTRALLKSGLKTDGAIVGEPTDLEICIAHRGLEWLEFQFIGKAVHGGKQKEGINAIEKAAKFMQRIEMELMPKIEKRVHPIAGNSSMNYGFIKGGTQPSTVAGDCILQIDRRWIPGEKFENIIGEYQNMLDVLQEEDPKFVGEMKIMNESLMEEGFIHEAMEIDSEHPLVKAVETSILKVTENNPVLTSFTAWTDGGLLSSYGNIPTIVLGPGNLESAHSAEECIDLCQLVPAALIYAEAALRFCGYSTKV